MLGTLLSLLMAERAGYSPTAGTDQPELKAMIDQLKRDSLDAWRKPASADSHLAASA